MRSPKAMSSSVTEPARPNARAAGAMVIGDSHVGVGHPAWATQAHGRILDGSAIEVIGGGPGTISPRTLASRLAAGGGDGLVDVNGSSRFEDAYDNGDQDRND